MTAGPVVDRHGVVHVRDCSMPGWVNNSPSIAGWVVVACASCGAVRLVEAGAR